ncbi:hypothetical protein QZH41_016788, partial [Actinostola sp. cb2023]
MCNVTTTRPSPKSTDWPRESRRDVCLENYKLDPCWYYTAPGLSWDAMLKMTQIRLELLTDVDMLFDGGKGNPRWCEYDYQK